jgi:hypothetical protein
MLDSLPPIETLGKPLWQVTSIGFMVFLTVMSRLFGAAVIRRLQSAESEVIECSTWGGASCLDISLSRMSGVLGVFDNWSSITFLSWLPEMARCGINCWWC